MPIPQHKSPIHILLNLYVQLLWNQGGDHNLFVEIYNIQCDTMQLNTTRVRFKTKTSSKLSLYYTFLQALQLS